MDRIKLLSFIKRERIIFRTLVYFIGVELMAIGILMIVGAKVGLSGPDAYISSICRWIGKDPESEWYGYLIWMHYFILWLVILVIRFTKSKIKNVKIKKEEIIYVLSILVPVFVIGPIVSLNSLWLSDLLKIINNLSIRYLIFFIGFSTAAFGGSCTIWTKMFIEPHSSLVLEVYGILNNKFKKIKFSYVRIGLDSLFFLMAIVIGFSTKQNVFEFNPSNFGKNFPLISYSTLAFILLNGIIFGLSLKLLSKILGSPKKLYKT